MRKTSQGRDVSETTLEIARKVHPPRYKLFKDLRPLSVAAEWAQKLDWRGNPYDRFLLRQEILRLLEDTVIHEPGIRNVFRYASRHEIQREIDRLVDKFPKKYERWGVLHYVLTQLPYHLAFKHGLLRHSRLQAALARFPPQRADENKRRTKGSSR